MDQRWCILFYHLRSNNEQMDRMIVLETRVRAPDMVVGIGESGRSKGADDGG